MRHMKKLAGVLLALVMLLSLATTAFAAETYCISGWFVWRQCFSFCSRAPWPWAALIRSGLCP